MPMLNRDVSPNSLMARGLATVAAVLAYTVATRLYAAQANLVTGEAAGSQLKNADQTYAATANVLNLFASVDGLLTLALVLIVLAIWWGPLRRLAEWRRLGVMLALLAVGSAALKPVPALAFAETVDKTEAYTILPNESAFWIPDVGANKDSQAQMDSEAYLQERKIALKRFVIPHAKLSGSGGAAWYSTGWDFYVPTGRLIIIDRTTYSREWVAQHDRGTSSRNEAFPCQSKEGLNVSVGVSIGASVSEANAAKYLFRFGVVSPGGNRTDPQVIFTSVYYGRKLSDVMDDVGRKKVQTLVCDQIASRTFDKVNEEAVAIMVSVKKDAAEYFASVGITLDFLGWADTFTFDSEVQQAVNRRFVASKDEEIAKLLAPHAETIQALAAAQALRSFGERSDGKLPTTIVGLPHDVGGLLNGLLKASKAMPASVPEQAK